jgi:hypothetical protein
VRAGVVEVLRQCARPSCLEGVEFSIYSAGTETGRRSEALGSMVRSTPTNFSGACPPATGRSDRRGGPAAASGRRSSACESSGGRSRARKERLPWLQEWWPTAAC